MGLLSLFKKPIRPHSRVGVSVDGSGLALAQVARVHGERPRLEVCYHTHSVDADDPRQQIADLVSRQALQRHYVNGVVHADDYQLLLVEAPDVLPAELKAAVRWRIKDLINFHLDDAVIDVFEIPEHRGRARMMYAVAARASAVQRYVHLLAESGMELDVIDIPEMALRNVAALLDADIRGVALLYLTPHGGIITLTRQHTLYLSRRVELNEFALSQATGGDADSLSDLVSGISLEVQRSLDYFESHYDQAPINQLVLAPLAEPIEGLQVELERQLTVSVAPLDLNELLVCEAPVPADIQARCLPAVGAALREESRAL